MKPPERDLTIVRNEVQQWMRDTVTIRRPSGEPTFDAVNLKDTVAPTSLVYTGQARVYPASTREMALGEEVLAWWDANVSIPYDAALPRRDDFVTIDDSRDSQLVSRVFRVIHVSAASNYVVRRMACTTVEPDLDNQP